MYATTVQEITDWPQIRCPDYKRQSRLGREDRAIIHSHGPVTCTTKTDLLPSLRALSDSVDCCFAFPFSLFVLACTLSPQHDPHFQTSVFACADYVTSYNPNMDPTLWTTSDPKFPILAAAEVMRSCREDCVVDEAATLPSHVFLRSS